MPKSKSTGKKKPSVKVKDLRAKKNPKGGETRQDGSLDADIRFKYSVPTE